MRHKSVEPALRQAPLSIMDISQLKISFLAGTLGQGGAERQLFYILRALRHLGVVPNLLCLDQGKFWEERIQSLGVPITYVGQSQSRLKTLFRIIAELRRNPPQILQSQHFYTSAYVGLATRLLRLPGIGALRSNGSSEMQASGSVAGWMSLRMPKVMAANSRAAIDYAAKHGVPRDRLYFLPNVVDAQPVTRAVRGKDEALRIIGVGSLVPCKRFDRFLTILAQLRRESSIPVKGEIIGGGKLKAELEKQAENLGLLPDGVEFKGSISNMVPVYQQADICLLTSDFEGTPNVLLEAMAAGLPVVATRVGGIPEIIQQGENGILADPDDERGLCAAVSRLVNDSRLRMEMGRKGRAYVERNHSVERLPTMLGELYRLALS